MLLTSVSGTKDYVPKAGDILVKLDRLPSSCLFCPLVVVDDPAEEGMLIACKVTGKTGRSSRISGRGVDCPLLRVGF